MIPFKNIFGVEKDEIKETVILMPLINTQIKASFKLREPRSGIIYSTYTTDSATIIKTNVGASFVGDATLFLKETGCKRIFLYGACGGIKASDDVTIGSIACVTKCFDSEGFSKSLSFDKNSIHTLFPTDSLVESFLNHKPNEFKRLSCITFGSLYLEDEMQDDLSSLGAQIVDMECSAFFAATQNSNIESLALFYISDIVETQPFYGAQDSANQNKIIQSIDQSAKYITSFLDV